MKVFHVVWWLDEEFAQKPGGTFETWTEALEDAKRLARTYPGKRFVIARATEVLWLPQEPIVQMEDVG